MATVNPQAPNPESTERRMSLRRARAAGGSRGGFSSGISTSTEGGYTGEADEVEDTVSVNQQVQQNIPRLAPPPSTFDPNHDETGGEDPYRNRQMLAQAAMAGDPAFAKEARLNMMYKLLVRGVGLDVIARELGISIHTAKKDRAELKQRYREAAKQLDINEIIGEKNAFYTEATALTMRLVSNPNTPTPMKLAGIRTALAAQADQSRFMASAGVYDTLQFRRAEDGSNLSDVQMLMQRTAEMLSRLDEGDEEEAPKPVVKKIVRRKRKGSFAPLTFDDADASNSSDENVNI